MHEAQPVPVDDPAVAFPIGQLRRLEGKDAKVAGRDDAQVSAWRNDSDGVGEHIRPQPYGEPLEFGLEPSATLFIDDSAKNVQGAIAAGWQAIQFEGAEKLRADLTRLGVL